MKVLLTGAFGNFGTTTLYNLLGQGHKVKCFDLQTKANRKTAAKFESRIETIWGDVRSPDDLAPSVLPPQRIPLFKLELPESCS